MVRHSQKKLQPVLWVAIIALLMQALLPTMLYASTVQSGHLTEICTAFGIKKIAIPDKDAPEKSLQREHCSICSTSDPVALFGNISTPWPIALAAGFHILIADDHAAPFAWLTPYLRGPPRHT